MARTLSNQELEAWCLSCLGVFNVFQGSAKEGVHLMEQGLALHRAQGNRIGQANTLEWLSLDNSNMERSIGFAKESLSLCRNLGNLTGISKALIVLARLTIWCGDFSSPTSWLDRMAVNYLGAGGQPFSRETPLLFVRGNHDTRGPAARSLSRFQDTPAGSRFYSFAHGPLAGVVLDAGEDKPDTHPVYAGLGDFVAFRKERPHGWIRN